MSRIKQYWPQPGLNILLLLLAPLALLWRWLLHGEVLYWGTLLTQFWPWQTLVKTQLLSGEWPVWNPLLGNGTPLLANLQSAVFYPPNLAALLLPVEQFLTVSVVLHLALAGLLMYAYTRHLGLEPFAATVSGLSYGLGGYLVGRTQFVPMIHTAAWLPLLLLLADRLAQKPGRLNTLLLALGLALQFLAGHAQLWFYSLLLVGAYVPLRSWCAYRSLRGAAASVAGLALAVGLALLLSAAQILPTAELVSQSPRSTGASRYAALTYSMWPWRLITLAAPDFFGNPAQGNYWGYANYWEDHAYAGALPLLAALTAAAALFRRKAEPVLPPGVAAFFAGVIPVSLLLALGWNTPLFLFLFDYVPGFNFFRAPARLLIGFAAAVSVLAGLGLQTFQISAQNRPRWQRGLVICMAVTLAGAASGFFVAGRSLTFVAATRSAGLLLSLAIVLLLLKPSTSRTTGLRPAGWQWLALAFVALDLLGAGWPLTPTLPPSVFTRPIAIAQQLAAQSGFGRFMVDPKFEQDITFNQYFQFKTFGPRDEAYWQGFKETLAPNFGVYAGLPAANNNDPLVVNHWQQIVERVTETAPAQRQHFLAALGVQVYIDGENRSGWPQLAARPDVSVQVVPGQPARAYFVPAAVSVPDLPAAIEAVNRADFDSRREVVIMGGDFLPGPPAATPDAAPVVVWEASNRREVLTLTAPQAGFVVLTDTFYPGWQAAVDGAPAKIWQANAAFRAVEVSAGAHRVEFWYWPSGLTLGLWLSGVSVLGVLALLSWTVFRHPKNWTIR